MNSVTDELLEDIFSPETCRGFPADKCPVCRKKFKDMRRHIINQHAGEMVLEGPDADTDFVHSQTKHLLKLLLMKRTLDWSIKTGNGNILSLLMKHMIIYFHALGYKNYANACFEHVAQTEYFLSEQMRELVIHEAFVNNQGKAMSNMATDLDIEHRAKFFKSHFTLQSDDPSQKLLDRLSKAQDKLQLVLEKFQRQFNYTIHF